MKIKKKPLAIRISKKTHEHLKALDKFEKDSRKVNLMVGPKKQKELDIYDLMSQYIPTFQNTKFEANDVTIEFINAPETPVGWRITLEDGRLAEGHANLFIAMMAAVDCWRSNPWQIEYMKQMKQTKKEKL